MEIRKIIKFGKSSYVVTLPQKWIETHNLEKGDIVHLSEKQDSILLSLNNQVEEKKASIEVTNKPLKLINKEIISYYLKNYREIILTGKDVLDRLDELKVFKEKLSSIEFTELSKDKIVLRDLTSPSQLKLQKLTGEIIEMIKILLDNLSKDDSAKAFYLISELDININKLSFLAFKSINYNLCYWEDPQGIETAIHDWRIVSALETTGDIIKRVARYLKNGNGDFNREISMTIQEIKSYFIFVTDLLNSKGNIEKNLDIYLDRKQSLLREIEELRGKIQQNLNLSLVISQLLKDILGQLDQIILSAIDIKLDAS